MAKQSTSKSTKAVNKPTRRVAQKHKLECKCCGVIEYKSVSTISYTCWECVSEMLDPSVLPAPKRPTGYPRGWKFMGTFVHINGTVYFKGVEQPTLKGTMEPTQIKQTPKDTRSKAQKADQKQALLLQISKLKKEIKKEKRITYKRKLESQLKQIQKEL